MSRQPATAMIAIDWGTSQLRGFRLDDAGQVIDQRRADCGILSVDDGQFAAALQTVLGGWLRADAACPVYLSGMIGSRQGWREAPYVDCPARLTDLATHVIAVDIDGHGRQGWIAPGLLARDGNGDPDVMRGEEVQILGLGMANQRPQMTVCLPGTHSKWVSLSAGQVQGFATYMTGEVYAAVRDHTILGRLIDGDAPMTAAFEAGVARAAAGGDLLHQLFKVRARGLFGDLNAADSGAFLSGLLIGSEITAAVSAGITAPVMLIGNGALVSLYQRALAQCRIDCQKGDDRAAAYGLFKLAREHQNGR